jgi:hypothetical protein
MTAQQNSDTPRRPSPRPHPRKHTGDSAGQNPATAPLVEKELPAVRPAEPTGREIALAEPPVGAVVTAARVGRLLGRSGWRIARQLPGGQLVEQSAQALQKRAAKGLKRLIETPVRGEDPEQRAVLLIQNTDPGDEPLRAAMDELLQRAGTSDRQTNQEYLFGSIISQLVPDEARLVAALAKGTPYATVDVQIRTSSRGRPRTHLGNLSLIGVLLGLASPENTATYLGRLHSFGLLEFDAPDPALGHQYTALLEDPLVRAAQQSAAAKKSGQVRTARRTVRISDFGRQFWAAADPGRATAGTPGRALSR